MKRLLAERGLDPSAVRGTGQGGRITVADILAHGHPGGAQSASTSAAEFAFKPEGDHTTVSWSMAGEKNFVTKAIGLIVSMDKMIGGDFEKGLAQIKSVAEAAAKS